MEQLLMRTGTITRIRSEYKGHISPAMPPFHNRQTTSPKNKWWGRQDGLSTWHRQVLTTDTSWTHA